MAHRDRFDPGERCLASRLGCTQEAGQPRPASPLGDRERAADGTDAAVERQLADGGMQGEPFERYLPRRREHGKRDREVERRSLLAQRGGREVDGDAACSRPLERGRAHTRPDAVLRLLTGSIGEADDGEAGQAAVDVRLHLDSARLETDQSVRDGACEHASTLGGASARV